MSEGPPGKFLRAHFVLEKPWWRHGTWRGRLERVTGQWTAARHSLCLSHQGGVTLDMGDYPADADADARKVTELL